MCYISGRLPSTAPTLYSPNSDPYYRKKRVTFQELFHLLPARQIPRYPRRYFLTYTVTVTITLRRKLIAWNEIGLQLDLHRFVGCRGQSLSYALATRAVSGSHGLVQLSEDHGTRQCGKGDIRTGADQHDIARTRLKSASAPIAGMVAKAATIRRRPCSYTGQDVCFVEPPLPFCCLGGLM